MDLIFTFMRDASWGFISAVLALLALGVAVWAARRRSVKELRFQRFSDRLVGVESDMGGRLKLLFDGKPRSNIWFVRYQFQSTGTEPIGATDFERPISFNLVGEAGGEILQASIKVHQPEQLLLELRCVEQRAEIVPAMINPGDKFSVSLVLADDSNVRMDYRIAGLREIKDVSVLPYGQQEHAFPWPLRWLVTSVILGFCTAVALWAFEFGKSIATGQ